MGKKKNGSDIYDAASGRDARDVQRVIRRLGLIESNQSLEAWYGQARTQLPETSVQRFYDYKTGKQDSEIYPFTYQDYDHARIFHTSWTSHALETQLVWMIPRLRAALSRAEPERRFLIELGAGPGAAAAIVSAVLKVPVITIDPEPNALGLPEQFAARTGGDVTSITASAVDLPKVVDGRIPAAIFGIGVFRYFQTHDHGNDSFSFMREMDLMFIDRDPDPQSLAFFQSNIPAEMIFAESGCPDYLAEVLLGARASGYDLATDGAMLTHGVIAGGEIRDLLLFHLTPTESLTSTKHPFIEMFEPLPDLQAGLRVEGAKAEAVRTLNDSDAETVEASQIEFHNGTMRREIFTLNSHLAGVYKATNLGFRSIKITSHNQLRLLIEEAHEEDENFTNDRRTVIRPLLTGPAYW
jgi:hypothetical protein